MVVYTVTFTPLSFTQLLLHPYRLHSYFYTLTLSRQIGFALA